MALVSFMFDEFPQNVTVHKPLSVWSKLGTSNSAPHYLWDLITCSCSWYLLLAQHSWNYTMWPTNSSPASIELNFCAVVFGRHDRNQHIWLKYAALFKRHVNNLTTRQIMQVLTEVLAAQQGDIHIREEVRILLGFVVRIQAIQPKRIVSIQIV